LTARPRTAVPASDLVDVLVFVASVIVMVCGRGTVRAEGEWDGICCVCVCEGGR